MLRESLRATGFWDNVVARMGDDGHPELAYGHHRLAALHEEYPPDHEVNLIIKELDNDQMLKIMARENMDEWASNAMIDMETVRATLDAYAAGHIKNMETPQRLDHGGPAVSYTKPDASRDHERLPYTGVTLANYLGWVITSKTDKPDRPNVTKVTTALRALDLVDEGYADLRDFEQFNTKTVRIVVQHAENLKKDARGNIQELPDGLHPRIDSQMMADVQQILQVAKNITNAGGSSESVQRELLKEGLAKPPKSKALAADPNLAVLRLAMQIERIFDVNDPTIKRVRIAAGRKKELEAETISRLDLVLNTLMIRTQEMLDIIHQE